MKTATLTSRTRISGLLIVCSVSAIFASPESFAQNCENWVAKAVSVQGLVEKNDGTQEWIPLHMDDTLCPGEKLRVGENSRAALHLSNNTYLRLSEKSLMSFPRQQTENSFWVELSEGVGHFISRIVNRFEVATPYVNAAVEGTEFVVRARVPEGAVTVVEGKVLASNKTAQAHLTAGQQANAASAQAPLTPLTVNSQQSVEWAIYYPPVLTLDSLHPADPNDARILNEVTLLTNAGRPDLALQQFPQNKPLSAELSIARAAVLLGVGRVADAEAELVGNMNTAKAAAANAMLAVSHASRNDSQNALNYAEKAVQADASKALTYIAKSYAQQANLQLEPARQSALRATQLEPENAIAWQRLAELELVHGNISAAAKASQQAQKIAPENPDVLTSAGFVALFELHLKDAKTLFEQALKQGSTNPQTRLGLGLTLLRSGDLKAGREQLEYAASLDPTRSVIRSYLGRAYFAEKRDDKAAVQWELAKQFDPNDPTPYFYQGVEKLFANDPSGAIAEIEKSQELNDKRNVYRSETLLQSDAATKSAALARAYSEIGNDQAVLIKGTEAIQQDPTNAEGHRLLADRYATLPRHDAARVSELLQAQLWGPLSAYPLQPQLTETNLAIAEGLGPERQGLNEYHSLFSQNGVYALLNGFAGSDNTWGNDAVASLLEGPVAFSLGQYKYETEGFRENADQSQEIYNAFAQWQVTPDTSVQVEAKHFEWDYGSLRPNFASPPSTTERNTEKTNTYRFGVKQNITANQFLLFSTFYQNFEGSSEVEPAPGMLATVSNEQKAHASEFQYMGRFSNVSLIGGVSKVTMPIYSLPQSYFIDPDFGPILFFSQSSQKDIDHKKGYLYAIINATDKLTVEPGLSYDKFSENSLQVEAWSPKLAAVYYPTQNLRLHAAAFKELKRDLVAKQTIEPTNLLGANQIYDEDSGAKSENINASLDYQIAPESSVGVLVEHRKVELPLSDAEDDSNTLYRDAEQSNLMAYWTYRGPNNLALSLSPSQEKFDSTLVSATPNQLTAGKTRIIPIKASYFINERWTFEWQETYAWQKIDFTKGTLLDDGITTLISNHSNSTQAWFGDISLSYKLPKRTGEWQLGVQNITDQHTEILNSKQDFLRFYPSRFVYSRIQLSF